MRIFKKIWRDLGKVFIPLAALVACGPALASDALPESGTAKLAAAQVCRPLATIDLSPVGGESSTECNGIVRDIEGQKAPNNLSIRCLENSSDRPEGHKYAGTCVQTDDDGDKLFMTYEGAQSGQVKWVGGTGKYKNVSGSGNLRVVVAPGGTASLFAYTLNYDVSYTNKAK